MKFPKPSEWPQLIDEYNKSELSQKEFVAKHDIPFSTFQYYLYTKLKRLRSVSGSSPKFLPVEVVASPALKARGAPAVIEAALRSGTILRFVAGTDTRYLAELFAAIG